MLRWGGSSPAPPAPQCMPGPNKLPSYTAALPPQSICPSALPPDRATWLNTRAACPQPVGRATWRAGGGEKQLATPPGWRGRGAGLALRDQDLELTSWASQEPSPTRLMPEEVRGMGGSPSHLHGWI